MTDVLGFCAELAVPPATTPPHPKRGCRSPCAPACRHELTSSLDAREEDAFGDAQLHRKTRPCGFVWLELQEPSRTDRVGGQAEWRTPRLRDLGSDMLGPYSGTNYVGYGCSTFLGCATSKDRRVMFLHTSWCKVVTRQCVVRGAYVLMGEEPGTVGMTWNDQSVIHFELEVSTTFPQPVV